MKILSASIRVLLIGAALAGFASCAKAPNSCFTIEKGQPSSKVNDEVEVNAACSSDADSFVWDFGDGYSTTGATAKHKYIATGTFTIKLTARNSSKETKASRDVVVVP